MDLGLNQQKVKFFKSCISEALIPKGLKGKFNLAMDVNDRVFVVKTQSLINETSSRLLDLIFDQTCEKENETLEILEDLKMQAVEAFGDDATKVCSDIRGECSTAIRKESLKYVGKLKMLRGEYQAHITNDTFEKSNGSRKLTAEKYIKEKDDGLVKGAPFPMNLRKARRNRPHKRKKNQNQEYEISEEDLEKRNPIIISKQAIDISEDGKSLMRNHQSSVQPPGGQ
jgi:hypothetical protein